MTAGYPINIPQDLRDALDAFEASAMQEIVQRGEPAHHEALVRLVTTDADIPPRHRQRAVHALGLWRDPGDVDDIVGALPRLNDLACAAAIEALAAIGTDEAYEAIMSLEDHESDQVRKFLVKVLAATDRSQAKAALHKIASADPTPWVRELANRYTEGD